MSMLDKVKNTQQSQCSLKEESEVTYDSREDDFENIEGE